MTDTCLRCGKPAFPHPYRHPLVLAAKKTPFQLEQALEVDADNQLEQMAAVAAEWKSYYWQLLQKTELREQKLCTIMEAVAQCMYDGERYEARNPYDIAEVLAPVADLFQIPTPHELLLAICEADQ